VLIAELDERIEPLAADLADRSEVEAFPPAPAASTCSFANIGLPASGRLETFSA